ncbi:MAG: HlyD family efflux transporter periplasmic adaptor subunit, partial [Thermoguttaceae bacterium]|nr:HlyD family efflux transporter periplasmic adaptor subunit [Thermoguttaceae bacterium]
MQKRRHRLWYLAAFLAPLAQFGCAPPEPAVELSELEPIVRPARVFVVPEVAGVEVKTHPVFVKGGTAAKLSFRIPGKIVESNLVVGARFQEGDVVAKLDDRDYRLALDRVEQGLVEARAALAAMETGARAEDVASLEAALTATTTQAEAAEKQFQRMQNLKADGAVSEVQFEVAQTARDAAAAAKLAAEKNLEKATKGARDEEIEMMRAKIAGLEIDKQLAENKLADTLLLAPFSGTVSEKYFDAFETVAPGVALATLVDDASFEGELSVSEEIVARRAEIRRIECEFDALPGKTFEAMLKEIASAPRKGNRSYLATIKLDAAPADGVLLGMVGVAKLTLAKETPYVEIPCAALIPGSADD